MGTQFLDLVFLDHAHAHTDANGLSPLQRHIDTLCPALEALFAQHAVLLRRRQGFVLAALCRTVDHLCEIASDDNGNFNGSGTGIGSGDDSGDGSGNGSGNCNMAHHQHCGRLLVVHGVLLRVGELARTLAIGTKSISSGDDDRGASASSSSSASLSSPMSLGSESNRPALRRPLSLHGVHVRTLTPKSAVGKRHGKSASGAHSDDDDEDDHHHHQHHYDSDSEGGDDAAMGRSAHESDQDSDDSSIDSQSGDNEHLEFDTSRGNSGVSV